jgi:hypothetical protein
MERPRYEQRSSSEGEGLRAVQELWEASRVGVEVLTGREMSAIIM